MRRIGSWSKHERDPSLTRKAPIMDPVPALALDHVIYVVPDLELGAGEFLRRYGLVTIPGVGVHPGGTSNRVIPLRNSQYVELLAVHDEAALRKGDPEAAAVLELRDRGGGLLGWELTTGDMDAFTARTGVNAEAGSIVLDDGRRSSWREASPPGGYGGGLPYVVSYDEDAVVRRERWGRFFEEAAHPSGATQVDWMEVAVDEDLLHDWVGSLDLPIRVISEGRGLRAVGITAPNADVVIR